MIRVEIIANQSVREDIVENLEKAIPDFLYTIVPLAQGRGKNSYKLGDVTWPETNFILLAYADDKFEKRVRQVVRYVKLRFPTEGIKIFVMHEKEEVTS